MNKENRSNAATVQPASKEDATLKPKKGNIIHMPDTVLKTGDGRSSSSPQLPKISLENLLKARLEKAMRENPRLATRISDCMATLYGRPPRGCVTWAREESATVRQQKKTLTVPGAKQ